MVKPRVNSAVSLIADVIFSSGQDFEMSAIAITRAARRFARRTVAMVVG